MTIDDLVAQVAKETTDVASLVAFVTGLKQQLTDALAQVGVLTPAQQSAIDGVFAAAVANDQAIVDAQAANVPTTARKP